MENLTNEQLIDEARGFIKQTASDFALGCAFNALPLVYEVTGVDTVTVTVKGLAPVLRYTAANAECFGDLRAFDIVVGSIRLMADNAAETKTLVVAFLFHVVQLDKMKKVLHF